jgi:hypothetical protein
MVAAVLLAIVWSTGPAAAAIVDRLSVGVRADVDRARLPLGDGHVTTSPQVGSVYTCQSTFNGRGALTNGPWIHSDGTWDSTAKASVDGAVSWPYQLTMSVSGSTRTITGNDLPDHGTGVFPVAPSDDAHRYDPNPNSIRSQTIRYNLPANPTVASQATCVPGGPIGVMLSGSLFFNALDALGRDAVAHEVQDACGGHPELTGQYHYHSLPDCLDDSGTGHSALAGYAFDGFGIYGHRGEGGINVSNADLDACHGHIHAIEWDGQTVEMYHYHATWEYPYTIGCFAGRSAVLAGPPQQPQAQQQGLQQSPAGLPSGPPSGPPSGAASGPPNGAPSGPPPGAPSGPRWPPPLPPRP